MKRKFRLSIRYFRELFLVLRNLKYLNNLRLEHRRGSDENPNAFQIAYQLAKSGPKKNYSIYRPEDRSNNLPLLYGHDSRVSCIHVNGIATDVPNAFREVSEVSHLFGRPFVLFYNNTNGFWQDLYDCFRMKVRNKSDYNSDGLCELITKEHDKKNIKNFVLSGYSQGSIIVCHAIDKLPNRVKKNIHITLLTTGSAQDELGKFNGNAIHVAHKGDFVARIGALHYKKNIEGEIKSFEKREHGFKYYLATIKSRKLLDGIKKEVIKK